MIYNFKDSSGQQWMVDTETLKWAQASSILATPSIAAAASNLAHFVPQAEGALVPLGGGRYAFEGRKPLDDGGNPQLSIIIILTVLTAEDEGVCVTFIQGNVGVTDFQHQQIKKFKAEALPAISTPTRPAGMVGQ